MNRKSKPYPCSISDCAPYLKNNHSFTIGEHGPVLMEDTILHETMTDFISGNRLDRVVFAKGYGSFGIFTVTHSMADFTSTPFLQTAGLQIPVFTRFSLEIGPKGTPDTYRNVRGMAVKFYTPGGIYDLLMQHIPVAPVRDLIRYPDYITSRSPSPINHLKDVRLFWDFFSSTPEATHFITWLYSDAGTLASFIEMRTSSVCTYIWRNSAYKRYYVRYHLLPPSGETYLTYAEAEQLAGIQPDIAGQELYDALAKGRTVEYELCVQVMDPADAEKLPFDPLDATKMWPESSYPLIDVGRLLLTQNTTDYLAQTEQSAFSVSNLQPGIELSNDKMLQGSASLFWDAQRRRIGDNFRDLPINQQHCFSPGQLVTSGYGTFESGTLQRAELPKEDNFSQAGDRYRTLDKAEKERLVHNISRELILTSTYVRDCALKFFWKASPELSKRILDWIQSHS